MKDMIDSQEAYASMSRVLHEVTKQLALFLDEVLPLLFDDWWEQAVVQSLSFQQRRVIKQGHIDSLSSLDLAALLRVLDENWYQISTKLDLTSESRHFAKEMRTIRNRWAHITSDECAVEDVYRDLDTLQRFASVIGADDELLQDVRSTKMSLLPGEERITSSNAGDEQKQENEEPATEFSPGQMVSLKSDPTVNGAVVTVLLGKPENRFKVFVGSDTHTYYASQLEAQDQRDDGLQFLLSDQFHSYLSALQIEYPGLSTLYSLNAARVDFIPYQFRPVLRFIRSDRPRLLIADGVGVGKTIEAGLILRELQARRDIQSVLIICPRPLVTERKWLIEMKRFEERFIHLDGDALRYCINEMDLEGDWPEQYRRAILPYSLLDETLLYGSEATGRRQHRKGLLELDPPPRFDLLIVDEAHHIRNQETYSHKAVRFFCDHAEAVLFLTATPIQLGNNDLFVLLNALRPDLILDPESFQHMAGPNPFINQAAAHARTQAPDWTNRATEALDQAASTAWGRSILRHNPEFNRIKNRIAEGDVGPEERVQLITGIEGLHTFSGMINRTRRRDIGDFAIRRSETVVIDFTPDQRRLHDELLQVQAEIFSRLHNDTNVKFMMTTIRRQAASCLFGLAPFLEEILNRHLDELLWGEADSAESVPRIEAVDDIEYRIQSILDQARALDPTDPKLDALRNILRDKQALPNNKIMLFSSFRHTLHYLFERLQADGIRVGLIHGGTPDEQRVELRRRFERRREQQEALDVLLFSEVGCEGLDYQFCDCIVNYDIPWNPMRIEQRIGRIDRHGQMSDKVAIYNLITPGTVDADIYERCLVRIGVFDNALGGSEEILGEIAREIRDIAEDFSLSDEERNLKLQQLADNKIRLVQEEQELEQRQLELFGIRLPEDVMKKEIEDASSFWLSPRSIQRLVTHYLQEVCGKEQEFILGDKPLKTLRLSQEARGILLKGYRRLPKQAMTAYREWETWLKGGSPHLPITFESGCASQNPEAAFIMPLHPLAKQAAMAVERGNRIVTALKVTSNAVPPGGYEFGIYQWRYRGIRDDLVLRPVSSSESVTAQLPAFLERAEEAPENNAIHSGSFRCDHLDARHYELWSEARSAHRRRTQELAEYRRESLGTSHHARISLLEEQLQQAADGKIRRMRQAQIDAAEADYARRIQDLDIAVERADVTADPVAYGMIYVEGNSK